MSASWTVSRPVISQSIQTIRSELFPFPATASAYGVRLGSDVGPSPSVREGVTVGLWIWPGVDRVSQAAAITPTAMAAATVQLVSQVAPDHFISSAATAPTTGAKTKVSRMGSCWRRLGRSIGAAAGAA